MESISQNLNQTCPRVMLAAPASGTGKTLLTCGLLRLLQRQGVRPAAFKCGPDYIDPMFHKRVLGIPSRNLDTFFSPGQNTEAVFGDQGARDRAEDSRDCLQNKSTQADTAYAGNSVREILVRAARQTGAAISVIEGVMGYFDGTGASGMTASSFDLAKQTQTPVILVVNARGMSRSVVPLVRGFEEYEKELVRAGQETGNLPQDRNPQETETGTESASAARTGADKRGRIRGVILNRISAGMYPLMKQWIEQDTDLRVIGYMPQETDVSWESRHLGLLQPEEISGLQQQIDRLADRLEKTIDLEALLDLARSAPALPLPKETGVRPLSPKSSAAPRVAVAKDEAFNFYYEDNLELLREYGADLVFFSPIHDRDLPAADGLLLGGGYPELHAQALADNAAMREQIRARAAEGMPVLAECGGFMYLQEELEIEGRHLPMCGALPGVCRMTDRLVRFGYLELENRGSENKVLENKVLENRVSENRDLKSAEPEGGQGVPEADRAERSAYLLPGHHIRGHEFHYFDSTCNGDACTAFKPGRRRSWDCMAVQGNIMAGFPHLYYRSDPAFAQAFVDRCREYLRKKADA